MRQKRLLAIACLVCFVLDWWTSLTFEGTEFSGGTLFLIREHAGDLFLLALILVFKFPRVASISALLSSLLSLPLYLYLVFPRRFQRIWPGPFKISAVEDFRWDACWTAGILFMLVSAYISARILIDKRSSPIPNSPTPYDPASTGGKNARLRQKLLLAIACLVCCVVGIKSFSVWEGTEFGSGTLAGNKDVGLLLFIAAMIVVFKYPDVASVIALVACRLSLPLYLYFVFPRPFRLAWPGPWKVYFIPNENFKWDGWWITGLFFILLSIYSSSRLLFGKRSPTSEH